MTIAEILKAKGIGDDVIQAVIDDMKTNKIFTASEENLDIRYGKLKTDHEGVTKQLGEANALIEEMKKATKGQEGLQQKITDYETQVTQLQAELQQTKIDAEIKVGLLEAKATDVDYLTYKLKEKGEVELDENGKIKDWDDKVTALKTQLPAHFETSATGADGFEVFRPNKLEKGGGGELTPTKDTFKAMTYEQRVALKQKNEALYKQLAK